MSAARVIVVAALVGACGDPVVDLSLQAPATAASFDVSCVASVQVVTIGNTYTQDGTDYKIGCVDLPMSEPTIADIEAALRGQFDVAIPSSGLAKVVVYANATSCAALPTGGGSIISADLIFYAGASYTGDAMVLPILPNLSCAQSTVSAVSVDMLALATTHKCSTSLEPDTADSGVWLGTLSPGPILPGLFYAGGVENSGLVHGTATITNARASVAPNACLALYAGDVNYDAVSCALSTPPACGAAGQLEVGVLQENTTAASVDQSLQSQYGPPTFGLVYSGSGDTGAPVAGATVTLDDPTAGTVVYYDVPPAAVTGGALTKLAGTATNATGVFAVYAQGFHHVTVSQGGRSQKIVTGALATDAATAIVRLN